MDIKDAHYYVNLIQVNEGNIEMSMTFVGHGSKIEGKSFLNLIMVPDMSSSMIFGNVDVVNVKLKNFRKYGYFIVRYNATGNTFSYARADVNKIVAEIKAGNLNGKVHRSLVSTSFKLYDDKATVAQYLVNNADSVFTDDRATFRRIAN